MPKIRKIKIIASKIKEIKQLSPEDSSELEESVKENENERFATFIKRGAIEGSSSLEISEGGRFSQNEDSAGREREENEEDKNAPQQLYERPREQTPIYQGSTYTPVVVSEKPLPLVRESPLSRPQFAQETFRESPLQNQGANQINANEERRYVEGEEKSNLTVKRREDWRK